MRKFILFDFDGVVVDSFAPAFEVNKIICPHITEYEYKKRFEGNINNWKDTVFEHNENCRHDVDFFAEYLPRMRKQVKMVPGMEKIIKEMSHEYSLIIISSTVSSHIVELLNKFNLSNCFIEIMGNDVHNSKVEKIKIVFSKYGITHNHCVFVTDTLGDIREAAHMKVDAIGVSWGFHESETLSKGKPFRIIDKPGDLPLVISEYFNNKSDLINI